MSKKFTLNEVDKEKILNNAKIFLAPALIVFLTQIKAGVDIKQAMYCVYLWALNVSIDTLIKFVRGN